MLRATRLGLATAACTMLTIGLSACAQEPTNDRAGLEPLVSIMELMLQTITPATNQLWSAWEEPSTPAEWMVMEEAAVTLLAASSLTATGGTGDMDSEWVAASAWQAFNEAMVVAGRAALDASRNQDQEALIGAGDLLLAPCEGCHQQFNPAVINAP